MTDVIGRYLTSIIGIDFKKVESAISTSDFPENKNLENIAINYRVSMSLFCLNHRFVYLLYFCPGWDRSKDRSKINKQGCSLARKGHGNGVNETYHKTM